MKTSTTASRQPFRTASFPSHRLSSRRHRRPSLHSAPARAPGHLRDKRRIYNPSARQTQRAEISPRRSTERVYRDALARRGQHTTATRAVRASGAFALVSLHFRYVRNFHSVCFTLRAIRELGTGEVSAFWSEQAGGSSSSSLAIWAVRRQVKYSLEKTARSATKTPHQQTRPFSSC